MAHLAGHAVPLILQAVDERLLVRIPWPQAELVLQQQVVLQLLILGAQLLDGGPARAGWRCTSTLVVHGQRVWVPGQGGGRLAARGDMCAASCQARACAPLRMQAPGGGPSTPSAAQNSLLLLQHRLVRQGGGVEPCGPHGLGPPCAHAGALLRTWLAGNCASRGGDAHRHMHASCGGGGGVGGGVHAHAHAAGCVGTNPPSAGMPTAPSSSTLLLRAPLPPPSSRP